MPAALDAITSGHEMTRELACSIIIAQNVKSAGEQLMIHVLKAKQDGQSTSSCEEALKKIGYIADE